ncbi:chondroitinase-B domain-containing protein [Gemmatimonadota bacterium]
MNTANFSVLMLCAVVNTASAEIYEVNTNAELEDANYKVQAGDTVNINHGVYSVSIQPMRSGAADRPITYQAVKNGPVTFSGDTLVAVLLSNRSFIQVIGIKVESVFRFLEIEEGDHHIIEHCIFRNSIAYAGCYLRNAHHNRFLSNTFSSDTSYGGGDLLKMTSNDGDGNFPNRFKGESGSDYNLVEGNYFGQCSHGCVMNRGKYNVIRRNIFDNPFHINLFASLEYTFGSPGGSGDGEFSVFEYNVIRNSGPAFRLSGIQCQSPNNIFRFNEIYNNKGNGIELSIYGPPGDSAYYCNNNRIYHNVIYGHDSLTYSTFRNDNKWGRNYGIAFRNYLEGKSIDSSRIFNNILYKNHEPQIQGDIGENTYIGPNQKLGDPLFIEKEGRDFRLRKNSPFIDKGISIAKTSGKGRGTSIHLATGDAYNFCDGFGIIRGDRIWINQQEAIITEVDYAGDRIKIDRALTWPAGAEITFPYAGAAPDCGAYEYGMEIPSISDLVR